MKVLMSNIKGSGYEVMKKKSKKINFNNLILMILSAITGFIVGPLGIKNLQIEGEFLKIIVSILIIITSLYIHIIIHEGGHYIFGRLTNYKFVSFRIGSLTLVKEEKFKIKLFNIKGTAGQCLMEPPEYNEDFPYFLYNLGGGLLNIIVSLMMITIVIFNKNLGNLLAVLSIFSLTGFYIGLTNLIPLKLSGISNDGNNIMSIKKSNEAKYSFFIQLKVNSLLTKGTRIKDMPLAWFERIENLDTNNPISLSRAILRGNYYQDKGELSKAKEIYEDLLKNENILGLYKNEIVCELIFCEIMTNCDLDKINQLYNKNIKSYVEQSKHIIGKRRLLYVYELLINKDEGKAEKYRKDFNKLIRTYPYRGEIESEIELMNLIN